MSKPKFDIGELFHVEPQSDKEIEDERTRMDMEKRGGMYVPGPVPPSMPSPSTPFNPNVSPYIVNPGTYTIVGTVQPWITTGTGTSITYTTGSPPTYALPLYGSANNIVNMNCNANGASGVSYQWYP
jgi:hypothetical protein